MVAVLFCLPLFTDTLCFCSCVLATARCGCGSTCTCFLYQFLSALLLLSSPRKSIHTPFLDISLFPGFLTPESCIMIYMHTTCTLFGFDQLFAYVTA